MKRRRKAGKAKWFLEPQLAARNTRTPAHGRDWGASTVHGLLARNEAWGEYSGRAWESRALTWRYAGTGEQVTRAKVMTMRLIVANRRPLFDFVVVVAGVG